MPYDNTLHLMGYLGKDPEGGYFSSGTAHAKLSVSCKRPSRKNETEEQTEGFATELFGQQAEYAMKYLKKGDCVSVWGGIWSRSYLGRDGTMRTVYEISADRISLIARKQSADAPAGEYL